jgi:hypothetical protein
LRKQGRKLDPVTSMAKRQHPLVRVFNEHNVHRHAGEWWKECARVDVEKVRKEVAEGEFAKRTAQRLCLYAGRRMESWERQVLKELVAKEQRERYERWKPIENGWKRRGVYF